MPSPEKLVLRCVQCGRTYSGLTRACEDCPQALLRAEYAETRFEPSNEPSIFRYLDWLPPAQGADTRIGPTVYPSEGLSERLGLKRLYIGYNGYAPEKNAYNPTASFKDFEALPTLRHLREHGVESVVLASAGNTARAFAYAGTLLGFTVHIVVPEAMLYRLWTPIRPGPGIHVTVVEGSKDYYKAIELAALVSKEFGVIGEGGARNVARRDGMGTSLLEFARLVGEPPAHYFQAVGSGTGGIAAWEASMRLLAAGKGERLPVMHFAQNAPFTPIHDAWTEGKPIRPDEDVPDQLERIREIKADVLANRKPPYGLVGGVRHALASRNGRTYAVTNGEAAAAGRLFAELEGASAGPAASVALGALLQAVEAGDVDPRGSVLVNITGGGDELVERDYGRHPLQPALRIPPEKVTPEGIAQYRAFFASA